MMTRRENNNVVISLTPHEAMILYYASESLLLGPVGHAEEPVLMSFREAIWSLTDEEITDLLIEAHLADCDCDLADRRDEQLEVVRDARARRLQGYGPIS